MIEIIWDDSFVKTLNKWKKRHPQLANTFAEKLTRFVQQPFEPSLRTHQLSGPLKSYWALSITYEYRLVFKFLSANQVLLIDIGTHEEVY